jgi:hypothetical protein
LFAAVVRQTATKRKMHMDICWILPFSLANKSIRANARGTVRFPEYVGTYTDFDHTVVDQYNKKRMKLSAAASGSTLNVMRVVTDESCSKQRFRC